jgi:hypothetical protein
MARKFVFMEAVPIGIYTAEFVGLEQTDHAEYGPGLTWKFRIVVGPMAGQEVTRITSRKVSNANAAGKMFKHMTGLSTLTKDNVPDDSQFVGKLFSIVIEPTKTGDSTRVASATPQGSSTPTAPAPKPPPRRTTPAGSDNSEEKKFWFHEGSEDDELLTESEVRARVKASAAADKIDLCEADAAGNAKGDWGDLKKFGLDVPF